MKQKSLNGFSKIFEIFLRNSLTKFNEKIFPDFIAAYRKHHSFNHFLLTILTGENCVLFSSVQECLVGCF